MGGVRGIRMQQGVMPVQSEDPGTPNDPLSRSPSPLTVRGLFKVSLAFKSSYRPSCPPPHL